MKPEIKAKWVAALRSGEYKQGKGGLRKLPAPTTDFPPTDGFCCLGVLCELYVKEHDMKWDEPVPTSRKLSIFRATSDLPKEVQIWAGLEHYDPKVLARDESRKEVGEPERTYLSYLNDGDGWDFARIANAIEESL